MGTGAGSSNGSRDLLKLSVQMQIMRNRAGVSRHGRFLLGMLSVCAARL
jgi:hypothetical protein